MASEPHSSRRSDADGEANSNSASSRDSPSSSYSHRHGNASSDSTDRDRRRAAVATAPFLAVGVANVALIVLWGVNPLWGFVVFVPVVFMTVLAWFAFREV
ncbi:hypothetical protein [Halomontanus rarus]|uniref:hypothetical protein n=1 Tax=Halomontanus rarus TaxID=3034020 RepID=UPI0023E8842A|nr:hypothetical protein [Halovivax sp. TS33]